MASSMSQAGGVPATTASARWSGTTRPPTRGRRWRRWRQHVVGSIALAVFDGKLYFAGGLGTTAHNHLSSVERYDPATNAWEAVAPMATARDSHGMATLDGKLYAVGGYNGDDGPLSSMEQYDPVMNAWEAAAPLTAARSFHGITVA